MVKRINDDGSLMNRLIAGFWNDIENVTKAPSLSEWPHILTKGWNRDYEMLRHAVEPEIKSIDVAADHFVAAAVKDATQLTLEDIGRGILSSGLGCASEDYPEVTTIEGENIDPVAEAFVLKIYLELKRVLPRYFGDLNRLIFTELEGIGGRYPDYEVKINSDISDGNILFEIICHEMSHHIWRTKLSGDQKDAFEALNVDTGRGIEEPFCDISAKVLMDLVSVTLRGLQDTPFIASPAQDGLDTVYDWVAQNIFPEFNYTFTEPLDIDFDGAEKIPITTSGESYPFQYKTSFFDGGLFLFPPNQIGDVTYYFQPENDQPSNRPFGQIPPAETICSSYEINYFKPETFAYEGYNGQLSVGIQDIDINGCNILADFPLYGEQNARISRMYGIFGEHNETLVPGTRFFLSDWSKDSYCYGSRYFNAEQLWSIYCNQKGNSTSALEKIEGEGVEEILDVWSLLPIHQDWTENSDTTAQPPMYALGYIRFLEAVYPAETSAEGLRLLKISNGSISTVSQFAYGRGRFGVINPTDIQAVMDGDRKVILTTQSFPFISDPTTTILKWDPQTNEFQLAAQIPGRWWYYGGCFYMWGEDNLHYKVACQE